MAKSKVITLDGAFGGPPMKVKVSDLKNLGY